jgi:hypothetical protein
MQFLTRKASMRLKQISTDWIQYVTEKGRLFYYNDADGSFQWENPLLEHEHSHPSTTAAGKKDRKGESKKTSSGNMNDDIVASSQGSHQPKDNKDYIDLSTSMWKAYLDPDSGSIFWYNEETHVSQWEMPPEVEDQHKLKSTTDTAASRISEEAVGYHHGDQQGRHLDLQLATGSNEKYSITTFKLSNTTHSGNGHHRVGTVAHHHHHHRYGSEEFEDNDGVVVTVDDHEHDLGI